MDGFTIRVLTSTQAGRQERCDATRFNLIDTRATGM